MSVAENTTSVKNTVSDIVEIGKIKSTTPDWQTSSLFLVWPEGLVGRNHLAPAYGEMISRLPHDVDLHIILKSMSARVRVRDMVDSTGRTRPAVFHELPMAADIWIRDWAPVPVRKPDGSTVLVKATYRPRYLKGADRKYAEQDDLAGHEMAKVLGLPLVEFPLVWDIGNFTHNGKGIAIVTKRIVDDNKKFTDVEIRDLFKAYCGIERLIVIDEEPEDETGHVDGTARFLDETTLAVARYPDDNRDENDFCDKLADALAIELGQEIRIVRLINGPPEDSKSEGIFSAFGNHLNFLRTGNSLLMPCYGVEEDKMAINKVRHACPGIEVIPVEGKGIVELSRRGGVLNCVSWGL